MIKNLKIRIKIEEEILGKWKEDAREAEQKMMKAKSKQTTKKWSRLLQVCGMNIRELERNIKNLKGKEKKQMKRETKINLDAVRNYLQYNGELCDNKGNKIMEIDIDGKTGDAIMKTEILTKVLVEKEIDELYIRMKVMKREKDVKRGMETVNNRMFEFQNFIDSEEFQYATDGENGRSEYTKKDAEELADKLEVNAKEQLKVEKYLVELEMKRLEKIRMILSWYERDVKARKMYYMNLYDNNGKKIEEEEM